MEIKRNHVYPGDVLEVLRGLPEKSVSMSMSSPPYWSLRDYGIPPSIFDDPGDCVHDFSDEIKPARHHTPGDIPSEGSILANSKRGPTELRPGQPSAFCTKCGAWRGCLGLEPTPELFIKHLCDIYDEVKRVTRDDGTCWVNLGDTYGGSGGAGGDWQHGSRADEPKWKQDSTATVPKSLVLIPFRFALEMENRGWILRNVIIWHKNNCMPSSASDRFTIDFEYLFFFSKKQKYYFEQQFEAFKSPPETRVTSFGGLVKGVEGYTNPTYRGEATWEPNALGRNKRAVWTINTKSYKEAHFATYPPELCETPISAGCPKEICTTCGTPRERLFKNGDIIGTGGGYELHAGSINKRTGIKEKLVHREKSHDGYTSCSCNAPFKPGIVLDPFMGSGTTATVAEALGVDWVGIEINPEYIDFAWNRINLARVARKNAQSPKVVKRYKKTREAIENGKQEVLF
jgi:site-specific DNA-methyltransferase (adenine-specific)